MTKLLGDIGKYLKETEEGELPEELEKFRHAIDPPISPRTPHIHISNFHDDFHYAPSSCRNRKHRGIDIQVKLRTPIFSPERVRVILYYTDGYGNIVLYSDATHILYNLRHLNKSSVPKKITERTTYSAFARTTIEKGEFVGRVGRWLPFDVTRGVRIPSDVFREYGETLHHLHIITQYFSNKREIQKSYEKYGDDERRNIFNPLLIFKKFI